MLLGLIALAVLTALMRYACGLGAVTNLGNAYPWGLWISFDLLCGVALAAGAFVTASAVCLFGMERFRPILRPAILTGFLGYVMVILALLVDLGRPERIWYLLPFRNPRSVMFEVGWCVMLYTTVLALEVSPLVWERLRWPRPLAVIRRATVALVILGTLLSTLHQSSLGALFLAMPTKVHPLWFSPFLPVHFFLTAVAVGPAMVILESWVASRMLGRGLELRLIGDLSKAISPVLAANLALKVYDVTAAGEWTMALHGGMAALFWLEVIGGLVAPMVLFALPSVRRNGSRLFGAALLVVAFTVVNRFAVSLIGWSRPPDAGYFPHWMELAISVGIVAAGVAAYALAARFLPLFGDAPHPRPRAAGK
ncbi:MAG: NrfD/PsrC family molybdoenzyme membrane anchor subunit [bacterium]